MGKNNFIDYMNFRYACKIFDKTKKIPIEDLNFVLEVARKSPSSFGIEPWKFIVIRNENMKQDLKPLCFNMPQIDSCSDLIVVLAMINNIKVESGIPRKRFERANKGHDKTNVYEKIYGNHIAEIVKDEREIYHWSSKQCYLASGNIMSAAASIEIDSCAIEGFQKEALEDYLDINPNQYQVALILTLGYRESAMQPLQLRENFEDIIEIIE